MFLLFQLLLRVVAEDVAGDNRIIYANSLECPNQSKLITNLFSKLITIDSFKNENKNNHDPIINIACNILTCTQTEWFSERRRQQVQTCVSHTLDNTVEPVPSRQGLATLYPAMSCRDLFGFRSRSIGEEDRKIRNTVVGADRHPDNIPTRTGAVICFYRWILMSKIKQNLILPGFAMETYISFFIL